jgi:3-phenylpropionate/trans-cinnamate dioxygenase ferredoxin subunit
MTKAARVPHSHAVSWHRVATVADLRDGVPHCVTIDDVAIALYRVAGAIHAVSDICTHEYVRLSGGAFDGRTITCPLHQARFDVATGRCLARPAERDLAIYAVRLDGDAILIGRDSAES